MVRTARAQRAALFSGVMGGTMKNGITKLLTGLSLVSVSFLGAMPAGAAALTNGTFSGYPSTGDQQFIDLLSSSTAIQGWTVGGAGTNAGVDWINTYWAAPNGSLSIDLNGLAPGSISQTFTTVPGATYDVSFSYAGNFDNFPKLKGFGKRT